jgi:hypothetical protein
MSFPVIILGLGFGLLACIVAYHHPRLALAGWVGVVCFVPVWWGVSIGFEWLPAVLAGLVVLCGALPFEPGRVLPVDMLFGAVVGLSLLPLVIGGNVGAATFPLVTDIALGYLIGRLLPGRVGLEWAMSVLTVALTAVATLAIAEFVLGWNPFVDVLARPGGQYSVWGSLQRRGSIVRAEGAFGHSIALGCSLAMAVPLALTRPWPAGRRLVVTTVLMLGVILTFSRAGLVSAVLGMLLTFVFLGRHLPSRLRIALLAGAGLALLVVAPYITRVFSDAGQEAAGSAAYRRALTTLIPEMVAVGFSPIGYISPDGVRMFGSFRSIDSALILFGLRYGWLPLLLVAVALAAAVISVVARRGTPATVAFVAQIPAIATVALITQYGILLSFLAGMAAASYASLNSPLLAPSDLSTSPNAFSFGNERAIVVNRNSGGRRLDPTPGGEQWRRERKTV